MMYHYMTSRDVIKSKRIKRFKYHYIIHCGQVRTPKLNVKSTLSACHSAPFLFIGKKNKKKQV